MRCPFSLQQSEDVMNYGFPSENSIQINTQVRYDHRCTAEMPYTLTKPATASMEKMEEASNVFVNEGVKT